MTTTYKLLKPLPVVGPTCKRQLYRWWDILPKFYPCIAPTVKLSFDFEAASAIWCLANNFFQTKSPNEQTLGLRTELCPSKTGTITNKKFNIFVASLDQSVAAKHQAGTFWAMINRRRNEHTPPCRARTAAAAKLAAITSKHHQMPARRLSPALDRTVIYAQFLVVQLTTNREAAALRFWTNGEYGAVLVAADRTRHTRASKFGESEVVGGRREKRWCDPPWEKGGLLLLRVWRCNLGEHVK